MAYESLAAFMRALRDAGELTTIEARVDPRFEIAEITDRVVKAGGPALLFRDVAGSRFPVLTNQFGTERRTALAFGARSLRPIAVTTAVPPFAWIETTFPLVLLHVTERSGAASPLDNCGVATSVTV